MATQPAPGATSLGHLIKSMSPKLDSTTYTFATLADLSTLPFALTSTTMLFHESPTRGWTLIIPQDLAQQHADKLEIAFPCKKITLEVHSSLDAVGFMAAITTRLAEKLSVGVNPVSGFFHDHLFVPLGKEGVVMEQLLAMAGEVEVEG